MHWNGDGVIGPVNECFEFIRPLLRLEFFVKV